MEYSHTNGNENYSFGHNAWPAENQQPVPASQGLGQSKEAMVLHPQHLHHMSQPGLPEHLENGHQELHGTHASGSTSHGQSPFAQHHSQQNSLIRLNAVFAESRSAQLPDLQDVYVSCSGPLGSDFPDMNAVLGTASGHDGTGMMTNHRSGSGVAMALNNGHHGDLVHPSCSLPSQGDANQTMQMREMQPQSHVVQIQSHAQCQQASAMQLNATMQQASPFGQPPDVVHLQASEVWK